MKRKIVEFEKYLGTSIEELSLIDGIDVLEGNFMSLNQKVIPFKIKVDFFGMAVKMGQVIIENNKIKLVSIFITETVYEESYNALVKTYGSPNGISKINDAEYESTTKEIDKNGFSQQLTKREYSLIDVDFNYKPDLILWKRESFKIEIRFDYKNEITRIVFRE